MVTRRLPQAYTRLNVLNFLKLQGGIVLLTGEARADRGEMESSDRVNLLVLLIVRAFSVSASEQKML